MIVHNASHHHTPSLTSHNQPPSRRLDHWAPRIDIDVVEHQVFGDDLSTMPRGLANREACYPPALIDDVRADTRPIPSAAWFIQVVPAEQA
jgi:hypothetical protein